MFNTALLNLSVAGGPKRRMIKKDKSPQLFPKQVINRDLHSFPVIAQKKGKVKSKRVL